jgi:hypothetical protein
MIKMKVQLNILANILEYDVFICVLDELNEKYGNRNIINVDLADVREIMGDAAYKRFVLKKLISCN